MNKPLNIELCHLLKKKGFDEKCNSSWWFESNPTLYNNPIYSNGQDQIWNGEKILALAPTISEVISWLYEKYSIWITVDKIDSYQNYYFYKICFNDGTDPIEEIEWDDDKCDEVGYNNKYKDSPTEAYETAIEYILNNNFI